MVRFFGEIYGNAGAEEKRAQLFSTKRIHPVPVIGSPVLAQPYYSNNGLLVAFLWMHSSHLGDSGLSS